MENINFKDLIENKDEVKNTHINIGIGKDISITELAEIVKEIVKFDGNIVWDNSKPDGTSQKLLDVGKLNKLGWKEKVKLEEGVKEVYLNYKKINIY